MSMNPKIKREDCLSKVKDGIFILAMIEFLLKSMSSEFRGVTVKQCCQLCL